MGWDVLLIGGGSGTGKTVVAPRIAARAGAALAQADDFRLVLQRSLPRELAPGLHFFLDHPVRSVRIEAALAAHRRVAEIVSDALEPVVAHHVDTRARVVLEGDAILPVLGTRSEPAEFPTRDRVRAVFLEERDRRIVAANVRARGRGFAALDVEEQAALIELQVRHGRWLADEARRLEVPVVDSRPWDTLEQRLLAVVGDPADPHDPTCSP